MPVIRQEPYYVGFDATARRPLVFSFSFKFGFNPLHLTRQVRE